MPSKSDRPVYLRLDEPHQRMLGKLRAQKQQKEPGRIVTKSEVLRELIEKAFAIS